MDLFQWISSWICCGNLSWMFFVSICLNDLWIDFKWIVDGLLWSYIDYVGVVLLDFLVDCSTYIVFVDLNWLALGTSRFLLMFQWFFLLDFVRKLFIKFIWMDVLWDFKLFIVVFQCVFVQWILRCCVFNLLSFWYLLRWHCFILLVLMKLLSAYGSLMIFFVDSSHDIYRWKSAMPIQMCQLHESSGISDTTCITSCLLEEGWRVFPYIHTSIRLITSPKIK